MNKYILRTSLLWLLIFAIVLSVMAYRSHRRTQPAAYSEGIQPIASGPSPQPAMAPAENGMAMSSQKMEAPLVPVQLSTEQLQSIGVRTGTVEYKQLNDDIRATGTVDIDERLLSYVQVRFPGYIRRVFADATYQYVRKGEPLFTIYSPDLVATQQEYLLARQNQKAMSASSVEGVASGAASLSSAAEQRLQQWDIPQSEIAKLKETGKAISDLTIDAPASGYITERNALPNMYVEPSTRLYTVADLSRVWVNAQVFQNDIGRLKPGDRAAITVDAYPDRTFSGRIEDILPQVDMTTRTVRVRLAISNPGVKLKPGMFVNVDLKSALGRQLTVPASAVFQTGTRQVVFLDHGNGNLEPKDVVLGPRVGDDIAVLKGLEAHQQIVTSANFLLDSESQLQAASGAYTPPPSSTGNAMQQAAMVNIDFTTDPNPAHRGSNTFRVKLTDAHNSPITGADVSVTFFMPSMPAMGMAAMNATTRLMPKGAGLYEGQGNLDTGGTWQVTVTVQQNGQTIATKQLHVNAEGGM
ncbi:efflux RND transporter periplasmic adaptor subunit [Granulicella mallensis]|uniref:Cu(I)/Ag(I) efflux system membrane fusion protein/cobalt-zinc-cadmium efflux system membrane fusion protein n=1 Tax=Granulicella mallensis TaxID=940614 RepID=A0A7W7ZQ05_9BACT|nr:efflux RND transporter periplasmic adaptor subunit [Granulicella mallensis]MBB5064015.1 Cu(I)/Ag(I) efflux system membrane fusion protein/cobalt-zinc-cadmium efflux system membrane fusion protein [Granulicella mallensis]